jgi:CRISPR/Cas system-associated exonuclease Cas4 (RecB family)
MTDTFFRNHYDSYDLWAHIDTHVTRPELISKRSQNLYPSEASVEFVDEFGDLVVRGGCHRSSYYRLTAEDSKPYSAYTQYIFKMGNIIEDMIIRYAKEMGIWVSNSHPFMTDELGFPFKGELDGIFFQPDIGQMYGVEIKSMAGYKAHTEVFGNKSKTGWPKIGQLLQTLIYTYLFHPSQEFNFTNFKLPFFRMVYFDREKMSRRTFKIELEWDDGFYYPKVDGKVIKQFTIEDIVKRYQLLQSYMDSGTEPPRDYMLEYPGSMVYDFFDKKKIAESSVKQYEANERVRAGKSRSKNPVIKPVGDWMCAYCGFRERCYPELDLSNYFFYS